MGIASSLLPGVTSVATASRYGVRVTSVAVDTAPAGIVNTVWASSVSPSPFSVITLSLSGSTATATPSLLIVTFSVTRLLLVALLAISTDASETVLYPSLAKLTV